MSSISVPFFATQDPSCNLKELWSENTIGTFGRIYRSPKFVRSAAKERKLKL